MAASMSDTEKAFVPYSDNANAPPAELARPLPYWARLREKRSRWLSWKTVILVTIIIGLIVGRAVEGPIRAHWHKTHATSKSQSTVSTTAGSIVEDAARPAVSHPIAPDAEPIALNDPPVDAESGDRPSLGVSIAASIDGEGNRQIYDLDTKGNIRVRKILANTYRYSDPQLVNVTEKPQLGSPLAAVAWRGKDQTLESHLIYVNKDNRIVRVSGTSIDPFSPTTNWKTENIFGSKAYGGLAFLNIGPVYDTQTLSGQLRILFNDQAGGIRHLNSFKGTFYLGDTGFKAVPGSDISVAANREQQSGQVTDFSIVYVDAKGGLKEILCDEKGNRNQYKAGRTIDTSFPTTFEGHFTATFGGPPASTRAYTLSAAAAIERNAVVGAKDFTKVWWQTADDKWYVPAELGGPLAALAWKDKEVRVIYRSKVQSNRLVEVGLSDQGPGASVKWFGRGFFY